MPRRAMTSETGAGGNLSVDTPEDLGPPRYVRRGSWWVGPHTGTTHSTDRSVLEVEATGARRIEVF
jgi:hypothetical protein